VGPVVVQIPIVVQLMFNGCSIVVQLLRRPEEFMDAVLNIFEVRSYAFRWDRR